MAAVSRLGLSATPRGLYGSFAGKSQAPIDAPECFIYLQSQIVTADYLQSDIELDEYIVSAVNDDVYYIESPLYTETTEIEYIASILNDDATYLESKLCLCE